MSPDADHARPPTPDLWRVSIVRIIRIRDDEMCRDETINLVATLLAGTTNLRARNFMRYHHDVLRLYRPFWVINAGNTSMARGLPPVMDEDMGSAMAWYLLDRRKELAQGASGGTCDWCAGGYPLAPFHECFVPQTAAALGACTNCLWFGRGDRCSLRPGGSVVVADAVLEAAMGGERRPLRPSGGIFLADAALDVVAAEDPRSLYLPERGIRESLPYGGMVLADANQVTATDRGLAEWETRLRQVLQGRALEPGMFA